MATKDETGFSSLTVEIPTAFHNQLRELARANNCSLRDLVSEALAIFILDSKRIRAKKHRIS